MAHPSNGGLITRSESLVCGVEDLRERCRERLAGLFRGATDATKHEVAMSQAFEAEMLYLVACIDKPLRKGVPLVSNRVETGGTDDGGWQLREVFN